MWLMARMTKALSFNEGTPSNVQIEFQRIFGVKHCSQAPPGATGSSVSQVTASGGDKPEKDDDGNHKAENKRFRSVQRAVGAGQAVLGLNKNNAAGSNSMRVLDQLDGVIDKELRMLESNDGEAAPPSQADSMDASEVMQRFKSGQ